MYPIQVSKEIKGERGKDNCLTMTSKIVIR